MIRVALDSILLRKFILAHLISLVLSDFTINLGVQIAEGEVVMLPKDVDRLLLIS